MNKLRALGYGREATSLRDSVIDYIRNYLVPGRYLGDRMRKVNSDTATHVLGRRLPGACIGRGGRTEP